MRPNPHFGGDLVTFTKEILNGKLDFCAVWCWKLLNLIFCRTLKYSLEVVCCSFWCKLCKCKYKSVNIRSYSRRWFLKMTYHELCCKCSLWIICKFFLFAFIMEFLCNKAAGLRLAILLKRHFGTGVFLWILTNF